LSKHLPHILYPHTKVLKVCHVPASHDWSCVPAPWGSHGGGSEIKEIKARFLFGAFNFVHKRGKGFYDWLAKEATGFRSYAPRAQNTLYALFLHCSSLVFAFLHRREGAEAMARSTRPCAPKLKFKERCPLGMEWRKRFHTKVSAKMVHPAPNSRASARIEGRQGGERRFFSPIETTMPRQGERVRQAE
jgi:hypothetical protein